MARASVGHVISIKVVNGDNMQVGCFTIEIVALHREPLNYKVNN